MNPYFPRDGKQLRILVVKPPSGYCNTPEARELIRGLGRNLREVLEGKRLVVLPHDWAWELVEVDGICVELK